MTTVRDRLWIFTCVAGSDNDSLKKGGYPNGSRMSPAEGAFLFDVPNLLMIRWQGLPAPPYDPYAISFLPLKEVAWSIVGSGGRTGGEELGLALDIAQRYPNVTGVYLDDFIRKDGTGAIDVEGLKAIRPRLQLTDRKLGLWVVLYMRQLDLPIGPLLEQCDIINLWTWNSEELVRLQDNLEKAEALSPGRRFSLGCYLWDFHNQRPVTTPQMEHQCELGLKWLKEGRIESIVFLSNTVADIGMDCVEWTREWIQKVGDTPIA